MNKTEKPLPNGLREREYLNYQKQKREEDIADSIEIKRITRVL